MTVHRCRFSNMNELLRADNAMISEYGQGTGQANHALDVIAAQNDYGEWCERDFLQVVVEK